MTKILYFISTLLSALCIAGGLAASSQPLAAVIVLLPAVLFIYAPRRTGPAVITGALAAAAALAGAGVLLGAPPVLMICGAVAALAAWDLVDLVSMKEPNALYERQHLQALALALGLGLLAALAGLSLRVQLPFIVVALLVGLLLFGLDRVVRELKR